MTESQLETRLPYSQSGGLLNQKQKEALSGWVMAAPAIILLLIFLIAPFLYAFYASFTNQRLISANPTEFVGSRNFKSLLTVRTFTLAPMIDETTGQPQRDENGGLVYPSLRDYTRNNPEYPQLDGLREWRS